LYNILPNIIIALKLVEQQRIDIAENQQSLSTTVKTNKKEDTKEGRILETEKRTDQDNASGQELEDLKE
jgi:hypothetical protein